MSIQADASIIIDAALKACLPDTAVKRALSGRNFGSGKLVLVSIGKAAWQMAACAAHLLGNRLSGGVVVTKYNHSHGDIPRCRIFEAGHPVPDKNSFLATQAALNLVSGLTENDQVVFLVSGGGSALFEKPLIPAEDLTNLTHQLLACGANIVEMNTIRKRMSGVKGGRFAQACYPAKVFSVVLSDIIGDPLDMIASGPAYPDFSTCAQAQAIAAKYNLKLTELMQELLTRETPKELANVETVITGSVRELCTAAAQACSNLGYEPTILTDELTCQAKEAGSFLASIARTHRDTKKSLAFIAGGETVVQLTGKGKGGRNQELALAAADGISGLVNTLVFSLGSDGTDGPTDAAGGIVDGNTANQLTELDISIHQVLAENNAYPILSQVNGLIFTGPTGTNVNDVAVVLLKR